jgi:hypothetical protein
MEENSSLFQRLVCENKVDEAFQFALKCDFQLDNSKMYYNSGFLYSLSEMVYMAIELQRDDEVVAFWYSVFLRTNGHLAADFDYELLTPLVERNIWPGDTFRCLLNRGYEEDVRVVVRAVCSYKRMKEDSPMGQFLKTDLKSALTSDRVIHVLNVRAKSTVSPLYECSLNPNMFKLEQLLSFVPAVDFYPRYYGWMAFEDAITSTSVPRSAQLIEMVSAARQKLEKYREMQAQQLCKMTFIAPEDLLKMIASFLAKPVKQYSILQNITGRLKR